MWNGLSEADFAVAIDADLQREFPSNRKDMKMNPNMTAGALGAKAPAPRVSPFDELARAVDQLKDIQNQFGELSDRIAGATPREVADPAMGMRSPNGLIEIVDIAATSIREIGAGIREDIDRISRRL